MCSNTWFQGWLSDIDLCAFCAVLFCHFVPCWTIVSRLCPCMYNQSMSLECIVLWRLQCSMSTNTAGWQPLSHTDISGAWLSTKGLVCGLSYFLRLFLRHCSYLYDIVFLQEWCWINITYKIQFYEENYLQFIMEDFVWVMVWFLNSKFCIILLALLKNSHTANMPEMIPVCSIGVSY